MAEGLGGRGYLPCRDRPFQAEILRAGRVPVPLRPRACTCGHPRSYTALDIVARKKRRCRLQRPVPHGLGRLRPAYRELRHQKPHPPRDRHRPERGPLQEPAQGAGPVLRLGPRDQHHRPRVLQVDPVDLPPAVQDGPGLQEGDAPSTGAPAARCVLANEEVVNGVCERCGSPVVQQGQEPVDAEDHRLRQTA